jgi:hypothetical protein
MPEPMDVTPLGPQEMAGYWERWTMARTEPDGVSGGHILDALAQRDVLRLLGTILARDAELARLRGLLGIVVADGSPYNEHLECDYCGLRMSREHAPTCPWRAIVAAVEPAP